jgi:hypothetical protein
MTVFTSGFSLPTAEDGRSQMAREPSDVDLYSDRRWGA